MTSLWHTRQHAGNGEMTSETLCLPRAVRNACESEWMQCSFEPCEQTCAVVFSCTASHHTLHARVRTKRAMALPWLHPPPCISFA